jgi:iron complex transport system substrate-binding protein
MHAFVRSGLRLCFASVLGLGLGCRKSEPPAAQPTSDPVRIVSLAPSLTEIICAVDGLPLLVGRTRVCDYPPEVASVPIIGDFGDPSLELLLTAHPTLIVDLDLSDETVGSRLTQMGMNRHRVPCLHLDDIPLAIRQIGSLIGRSERAGSLAQTLTDEINRLREFNRTLSKRPRVFIEIWNDPLNTAGAGSYLSELVNLSGGTNIADEVDKDYFQVSPEWVIARNPEVIFCFYMTPNQKPGSFQLTRDGWNGVDAVKNHCVFSGFDNNVVLRPGPRVLEAVSALRQAIDQARPQPPPVSPTP